MWASRLFRLGGLFWRVCVLGLIPLFVFHKSSSRIVTPDPLGLICNGQNVISQFDILHAKIFGTKFCKTVVVLERSPYGDHLASAYNAGCPRSSRVNNSASIIREVGAPCLVGFETWVPRTFTYPVSSLLVLAPSSH